MMMKQPVTSRYTIVMILLGGLTTLLIAWAATVAEASSPSRLNQDQVSLSKSFVVNQDAFVSSGFPGEAYGKWSSLFVGRSNKAASPIRPYMITQMLLEFDVGEITGTEILNAKLRLYPIYYEVIDPTLPPIDLSLWTVMQPWEEATVNWLTKPSTDATPLTTVNSGVEIDQWIDIQIPAGVVKDWAEHPEQNHGLLIGAPSVESSGGQIRNYLSREHASGEFAPRLVVDYREPPTPVPPPTPGIAYLRLIGEPTSKIEAGESITYTIHYSNGPEHTLENVVLTGTVPVGTEFLAAGTASRLVTDNGITAKNVITWNIGVLEPGSSGSLNYVVRRPPLSLPENYLAIVKSGPRSVKPKESITYQLGVTNYLTEPLSSVVITDVVPVNAQLVVPSDPSAISIGNRITWTVDALAAGDTITKEFSVLPTVNTGTIVNSAYGVQAGESLQTTGNISVATLITEQVLPPSPDDTIINQGVHMSWAYAGKPDSIQSNPVFNPGYYANLPLLQRP